MRKGFVLMILLLFVFGLSSENEAKQNGSIPLEVVMQQGKGFKTNGARIGNQFFYAEDDRSRKADYYPMNRLMVHDLTTKKAKLFYEVTENSLSIASLYSSGRWLVWLERPYMGNGGRVRAMDSRTKEIMTIATKREEGIVLVGVSSKYVAILETPYKQEVTLNLWSFAEQKIMKRLQFPEGRVAAFIAITDDELVWSEIVNGKGTLAVYNIKNKRIKRLSDGKTFPFYPEIGAEHYYSFNFPDREAMSWSTLVLTEWNRQTGRATPVDFPDFNEANGFHLLVAHGRYVAFNGDKGRVYLYKREYKWKRIPLVLPVKGNGFTKVCFDAQGNLFISKETEGKDKQSRTTLVFVRAEVLAKY